MKDERDFDIIYRIYDSYFQYTTLIKKERKEIEWEGNKHVQRNLIFW